MRVYINASVATLRIRPPERAASRPTRQHVAELPRITDRDSAPDTVFGHCGCRVTGILGTMCRQRCVIKCGQAQLEGTVYIYGGEL